MKIKIGDITKIRTGKLDANAADENGQYPFFTCSKEPLKINTYSYDCECVLVAGNGDLNVKYYNGKFDAYQRTYIIEDDSDGLLFMPYLYFFMESYIDELRKQSIGGVIKYIKLKNLTDALIELPSIEVQRKIVNIISKSKEIVRRKENEFELLDELVRARFVEMFGTIRENSHNYPRVTLKEVCHKITDGKHGGCKQEDNSGYYYVGAREIYDGKIHYDTAPQITYDDFSKDYRRCNLEKGDMVIVNTGATIGKSAIASSHLTEKTLLQKSVALIKVNSDIIIAEFLRYCYMVNPSMYMVKSASAQPNLLLSKMNSTIVYLPPIDLQRQFASFVEEIDKSRSRIQKSLEASQELFDSLMQEYFG
ncbi:restriction endonuclease subunit S [Catenibacterium mitsuokai]|uniref:restriction endonuclease subunit S n=1 Tax=Catenibacterium mitsuokai TaxID=100886 RepID=UPI003F753857